MSSHRHKGAMGFVLVAPFVVALASCGGGGSGGGDSTPAQATNAPPVTNVAAAYRAFLGSTREYILKGTSSASPGVTINGDLKVTPPATAAVTIGSAQYQRGELSVALTASVSGVGGSTLLGSLDDVFAYDTGTVNWAYDFSVGTNPRCVVRSAGSTLPTAAAAGSSGPYISGPVYANCSYPTPPAAGAASIGTLTTSWSYTTTAPYSMVCINSNSTAGNQNISTSYCAEVVDVNGTLGTHAKVSQTDNLAGTTVTLSN